jgi:4-amino-4-deoxy-L-arabinose transferase-like glycosyltransferase
MPLSPVNRPFRVFGVMSRFVAGESIKRHFGGYWLALVVILLLALLLRTIPLTYSHFWDETVYLQHAKIIVDGRTNYDELDYRPPLLPFLYAAGFTAWNHIYVANLVQGVVTALAVLFVFLYAKPLFGPASALLAAFLLAFSPYFVDTSHDLLTDMPAVTFMLAAMWLFDKPHLRFAFLSGVLAALAVQTRFTSLFVFIYFVLDAALSPKKMRSLALLIVGAVVGIVPYLIWVQWTYGDFLHPFVWARRITDEWTVPVPAGFYYRGLLGVFPLSMLVLLGLGVFFAIVRAVTHRGGGGSRGFLAGWLGADTREKRQLVLLTWGLAFLAYMISIPHKEVRYLLPLAIPVVLISTQGLTELLRRFPRHTLPIKVAVLLICIAVAALDYSSPFQQLMKPWADRSESETVRIALYLREVSALDDTVYAAHDFPVLAFYSERRTVSLLPIQVNFDKAWRDFMARPGYFVYYDPAKIGETHSGSPVFKPDRSFLEASPNFRVARVFLGATVYRYEPER